MQGGRGRPGGRGNFPDFNDPFAGFGGLGGGPGSLISNLFGGRDPFDDPFFTRPFGGGGMSPFGGGGMSPFGGMPSFPGLSPFGGMPPFGGGMLESSFFGPSGGNFPDMQPSGFIENQAPQPKRPRGLIIEEINSDHENEDSDNEKKENPRKRGGPSTEPYVEVPDDEVEERSSNHLQHMVNYNRPDANHAMQTQPQARSFTFQSSSVSYGGANGEYYTSSKTRRMGSDGLAFEEVKEADTTSGKATHRVSKGLHNKGHSVTRKLKTDGKVDTMQTLHNLDEDELSGFEEAWKGTAQKHLPGWTDRLGGHENRGDSSSGRGQASQGGWALPSNVPSQSPVIRMAEARDKVVGGSSRSNQSGRVRADVKDKSANSRGTGRE